MVEKLKGIAPTDQDLSTTALQYVISHPVRPVAIPGAKSPEQAAQNARAGCHLLTVEQQAQLIDCLELFTKPRNPEPAVLAH